ncbi:hypothetical protein RHMOL_Rhmol13G0195200 [Rhododendron molle]|uniref:Uncharacterized protein n=1 Tax=Rhododendron molle TaxID=49168 RepID=A0ACC0L8H9_RHOML|nr:hypothetical protein RHMOL_Rhmol13G0195200 [Rhododendron molle]
MGNFGCSEYEHPIDSKVNTWICFAAAGKGTESLDMLGCLEMKNCRLPDVSPLVDATLNFDSSPEQEEVLRRLLESLAHVKNITLDSRALQVGTVSNGSKRFALSTIEVSLFNISWGLSKTVLPAIANLWGSSPNLETLVITLDPDIRYHEYFGETLTKHCDFGEKLYWTSQKTTFECLKLHLMKIKLAGKNFLQRLVEILMLFTDEMRRLGENHVDSGAVGDFQY